MPKAVKGYNADIKPYAYDVEKAKSLLAEAGATGMTLKFAYPSEVTRPYMPDPQKLYDAIKTDFEAVGIKVETGFDAFVIRARLQGSDDREWHYIRRDGSRYEQGPRP